MIPFHDLQQAEAIFARLETWRPGGRDPLEHALIGNPNPDAALVRLERWLAATGHPSLVAQHLLDVAPLARILLMLFGASAQLADVLVQNPELSDLILDPSGLAVRPSRASFESEGRRLLGAAISRSHRLDRLRYLKQRGTLRIAVNDLARLWPEEAVWEALSDLALATLLLLRDVAWEAYAREKEIEGVCPVEIVAMGKLGGLELNYSSDIDLVYVMPDDVAPESERHASRFAEVLGRALTDRMGRGSLYRVDLRLRPYGGTGAIVNKIHAVETYYRRYAEPWEHLALIRSLPLVQSPIAERWDRMRDEICFQGARGEWAIAEMLELRERIDRFKGEDDLKRGPGGIRDVEFLVQLLQMLHGKARPELRGRGTLPMLRKLRDAGLIAPIEAATLEECYTALRQIEHRCQLVDDRQTHDLPSEPEARRFLSWSMGFRDWDAFMADLVGRRWSVRAIFDGMLRTPSEDDTVPMDLGPIGDAWLGAMPEPAAYRAAVAENTESRHRMLTLIRRAPALIDDLKSEVGLTESIVSGEIEEWQPGFPLGADLEAVGRACRRARLAAACRWALVVEGGASPGQAAIAFGEAMTVWTDQVLCHLAETHDARFDVVALGSYASGDFGFGSDADLILVVGPREDHAAAEQAAQVWNQAIKTLRRFGSPLEIDLRLRPEGAKGFLVATDEGLRQYEASTMEPWERLALSRTRPVFGRPETAATLSALAARRTLDRGRLEDLLAMKRRIESERVRAQHLRRHVKLGWGGLDDIDWMLSLAAFGSGVGPSFAERLREAGSRRYLNAAEALEVEEAREFLLGLRMNLAVLGYEEDLVPENPNKLDRLAHASGFEDGNTLLARYQAVTAVVRSLFEAVVDQLRIA
ncbi:MAG TPA: hypothetical protein PLH94_12100 [Fimbriimonadaceae bacterium]|nr:hypothetical protein [Fimbriimonadaceae bacterium]